MRKISNLLTQFIILNSTFIILISCSVSKQISKSAQQLVIKDSSLLAAHVGISIYEPAANKYWYNYQGDKYFVPASNTKLPTCYAAMKYLGDSLVGLKYGFPTEENFKNIFLVIQPTGDPTFLHPDFKKQPVFNFLDQKIRNQNFKPFVLDTIWKENNWGSGWSWNDYQESFMAERSPIPIFGNTINVKLNEVRNRIFNDTIHNIEVLKLLYTGNNYFDSLINKNFQTLPRKQFLNQNQYVRINRTVAQNEFLLSRSDRPFSNQEITFATRGSETAIKVLGEMFRKKFAFASPEGKSKFYVFDDTQTDIGSFHIEKWNVIHSQPTDSLLKITMHRSDNFFAEQTLLMVSNERLGYMNDEKIIDTLLKTDLKDLPQKPRWVDGSGLSRYNLFTPQDFVSILNKIKNEFGMDRIKVILPTGNTGTLANYYKAENGYLFAKTGTLSGVVALSGYLYTKKNKLLIFSVLINNHQSSATAVRRAVEKFIEGIREKY